MADFINPALYLEQQVTRYEKRWYRTVYPERWAANGKYHIAEGDLALGERYLIIPRIDTAGKASIHTGRAVDIPLIKLGSEYAQYNTRILIMRGEWDTIADLAPLEVANRSGVGSPRVNIVQEMMNGLSMKIAERENELIIFGDRAENMVGIFSSPIIPRRNIPAGVNIHGNGIAGNITYNSNNLSPEALYELMRGYLKEFHKASLLTAEAIRMLCTIDLYDALCRPFENYHITPMELLTTPGRAMFLREIVAVNELSSDYLEKYGVFPFGTNRDRFMLQEDRLQAEGEEMPMPSAKRNFCPLDRTQVRQAGDTLYSVTAFSATSEYQVVRPFAYMYVDYDKFQPRTQAAPSSNPSPTPVPTP